MSKRISVVAVAMLLASSLAQADEEMDDSIPGFGLGVGVGIGNAYSGGTPATPPLSVYATFNLGESFPLEPNLGYGYIAKGASAASIVTGGAEAQMAFRWYFDPTITGGGQSVTVSRSKFGTGLEAILFLRIHP